MQTITDIANLAFRLCLRDPAAFGGIWLKTSSAAHIECVQNLLKTANVPLTRIHPSTTQADLIGGIDPIESLAHGRLIQKEGLLQNGGAFLSVMSERHLPDTAAIIGMHMDQGALGPLILIDESASDETPPPQSLTDRMAFQIDLTAVRAVDFCPSHFDDTHNSTHLPELSTDQIQTLVGAALHFGIEGLRPVMMAHRAAQHLAALRQTSNVSQDAIDQAAALVFAHRAQYLDTSEDNQDAQNPDQPEPTPESAQSEAQANEPLADELVIDAVKAMLPPDVLSKLADRTRQRSHIKGAGFGTRQKSNQRGRPKPAHPGRPTGQQRVDIMATLRTAAPWQRLRQAQAQKKKSVIIFPSDIHIQRFENRSERVLIFAVDASGSAAMNRMGEAKGAVELMLAQAYAKRDFVSLIGFRDTRADLLLPPTRSLVQTKKNLASLAAGGGTPLASGLDTAISLASKLRKSGKAPSLAFLTDGKANVDLNGQSGRQNAMADAVSLAKQARNLNIPTVFIDCGRRTNPDLVTLAENMGGHYISLPRANAHQLSAIAQSHLES